MGSGLPVGSEGYEPYVCDPAKALASFGDVDFIEYGGALLMPGVSDDDSPYLEIIEPPESESARSVTGWSVYRVEPEQFKRIVRDRYVYLVSASYAPTWPHPVSMYDEWVHGTLDAVAESVGCEEEKLYEQLCSDDPVARSQAYISIAGYHGWFEFDQYPLRLSKREVHARYGMLDSYVPDDSEEE